jgi:S-formylglutathione hydrolase
METISENRAFGGVQGVYRHASARTGCDMTFAAYLPPQVRLGRVPCLWFLSGLTCTHENAMLKSGAQLWAARHGIAVIFPDTSPRGDAVADADEYDLGQGAGFYLDATEEPWSPHFRMYSYITQDLQTLVTTEFPIELERQGITGHSMGGHGALTLALRHPELYRSVSAFAPIGHPAASDWGRKQFAAYLGEDEEMWAAHDASLLLRARGWKGDMLLDQGAADPFLDKLQPESLSAALAESRTPATCRLLAGYDHSYFFVASFMEDHVRWHAERL